MPRRDTEIRPIDQTRESDELLGAPAGPDQSRTGHAAAKRATVLHIDPARLSAHPLNRKIYDDREESGFRESIRQNGVLLPIVVTPQLVILGGHRRWQAALSLALPDVPVLQVDPENEIIALIELNSQRPKSTGERVREARALEAEVAPMARERRRRGSERGGKGRAIGTGGGDVRQTVSAPGRKTREIVAAKVGLGYETLRKIKYVLDSESAPAELKQQLENDQVSAHTAFKLTRELERSASARSGPPAEVSTPAVKSEATVAFPEYFPPHVVCADGLDQLGRMEEGSVVLGIVDPPRILRKRRDPGDGTPTASERNAVSAEEYFRLLRGILSELYRLLSNRGSAYIFTEPLYIRPIFDLARTAGLTGKSVLCWVRKSQRESSANGWVSSWAPVLHVSRSTAVTWRGPSGGMANVIETDGEVSDDEIKPIVLLRRLIELSSNPGDLVLDPFAGSGVTGEAAFGLGRRSVLVEKDPGRAVQIEQRLSLIGAARPN